jgi:hypothetical protein
VLEVIRELDMQCDALAEFGFLLQHSVFMPSWVREFLTPVSKDTFASLFSFLVHVEHSEAERYNVSIKGILILVICVQY